MFQLIQIWCYCWVSFSTFLLRWVVLVICWGGGGLVIGDGHPCKWATQRKGDLNRPHPIASKQITIQRLETAAPLLSLAWWGNDMMCRTSVVLVHCYRVHCVVSWNSLPCTRDSCTVDVILKRQYCLWGYTQRFASRFWNTINLETAWDLVHSNASYSYSKSLPSNPLSVGHHIFYQNFEEKRTQMNLIFILQESLCTDFYCSKL
jgi:hypothetical protein